MDPRIFRASIAVLVLALLVLTGLSAPAVTWAGADGDRGPVFEGETGQGYFITEKNSFTYLYLEGDSRTLGYLHGTLLAEKVQRALDAYAYLTEYRYGFTWGMVRKQAATYWPNVPGEYRLEIEGLAEGAAEKGVHQPEGSTPVDWVDILALNAMWDIWWRVSAPGNPLWWWPFGPTNATGAEAPVHHCSAFIATGDATLTGEIIMVQSLWMPYYLSPAHAVFLDFTPASGNRILMEVTAGMIWSGTEWYQNSAGLMVAETTLGVGPYNYGQVPAFVRIRNAVQYASSIDEFTSIMLENSNGAYCGDYLVGDAKTNEAAIVELGGQEYEVARTFNGFLASCNYPWDPEVAEEMGAEQGWGHGCYPRYVRWEQLSSEYYGNITVDHAKTWIGDHYDTVEEKINPCSHTLCGHVENASGYPHGSLDAKVTTASMTERMESWARFGHSCGRDFVASDHAANNPDYAFPNLRDMLHDDWKTYSAFSPVEVLVTDSSSRPAAGAEVTFCSKLDGTLHAATTDSNGVANFQYLPNSDYYLNASKGGLQARGEALISGADRLEVTLKGAGDGGLSEEQAIMAAWILIALLAVPAGWFYLKKRREKA